MLWDLSNGVVSNDLQSPLKVTTFVNFKELENGTRQSYSTLIGSRRWSVKWCYHRWPWTTPNPDFKGTPLFNL